MGKRNNYSEDYVDEWEVERESKRNRSDKRDARREKMNKREAFYSSATVDANDYEDEWG